MTAAVMELANTKGAVRKLRHKVRGIYGPLYGKEGLTASQQMERIDAALARLAEAKEALEQARLVIQARDMQEIDPGKPKAVEDDEPEEETEVEDASEDKTTGHPKLDALLTDAWRFGFIAEVAETADKDTLAVKCTNAAGDVVRFTFDIKRNGVLPGEWHRAADGKDLSVRKPYSIRAAFQGVAKN